jgi:hypothetical protein
MSQGYRFNGGHIGGPNNWSATKEGIWDVKSPYVNLNLALPSYNDIYLAVSKSLSSSASSSAHTTGPSLADGRAWLGGTSNGGQNLDWVGTDAYYSMPEVGYQKIQIFSTGSYRLTARGAGAGKTDANYRGRGVTVQATFSLTQLDYLLIAVGQGVPDFTGDHCNGGAGATWIAHGAEISSALMLLVGNGAGGDTSDGTTSTQPNTTLNVTVTNVGGVSGSSTTPVVPTGAAIGFGGNDVNQPNSGGYLSAGTNNSGTGGGGFRAGALVGGTRSNSTAGYGGFGGGSGGFDERGSAGGGFTGAKGVDNTADTGHGSSFIRGTGTSTSIALNATSATYQNADYTSTDQFQGWARIEKL